MVIRYTATTRVTSVGMFIEEKRERGTPTGRLTTSRLSGSMSVLNQYIEPSTPVHVQV